MQFTIPGNDGFVNYDFSCATGVKGGMLPAPDIPGGCSQAVQEGFDCSGQITEVDRIGNLPEPEWFSCACCDQPDQFRLVRQDFAISRRVDSGEFSQPDRRLVLQIRSK